MLYNKLMVLTSYKINALLLIGVQILLSLFSYRHTFTAENLPLVGLFLLIELIVCFLIYKGNVWAMGIFIIYLSLDTLAQVFIFQKSFILPLIFWYFTCLNLWYAIKLERQNALKNIVSNSVNN